MKQRPFAYEHLEKSAPPFPPLAALVQRTPFHLTMVIPVGGNSKHRGRILVVDDDEDVLQAARLLLKNEAKVVETTTDPDRLPGLLKSDSFDVVLLDMNFRQDASSGREGFRWLRKIKEIDPQAVVVLVTAYGDVEMAVRAMKEGAMDFVQKPWRNEKLLATVSAAVELRRTREEAARRRSQQQQLNSDAGRGFEEIVGESDAIQQVFRTVEKVAGTDANVLILGENGTGKELVARAIHRHSDRSEEVFVSVDVGALHESLFESEFFGHSRNAFTGAEKDRAGRFEVASGGTLFLDEIGNVPTHLQKKLLTVLQRREVIRLGENKTRPIDIRLISATNMPIYESVSAGDFRQDLLYRINTVEIRLPPLRDRTEDVPLLAEHFLKKYAAKYEKDVGGLTKGAIRELKAYHWPGNVRELEHMVERAVIMSDARSLRPDDFFFAAPQKKSPESLSLASYDLDDVERQVIEKALKKHDGNVSRTAKELGLTRSALYRRLDKYDI